MSHFHLLLALLLLADGVQAQPSSDPLRAWAATHEAAPEPDLISRADLMPAPSLVNPALSPDGRHLVYGTRDGLRTTLKLLDTRTMQTRELFSSDRVHAVNWTHGGGTLLLELDDALAYVPMNDPAGPSYLTRLERDKRDALLGPGSASGDHVLVTRRREGDYLLERLGLGGQAQLLLRTPSPIEQALLTSGGSGFVKLQSARGQAIHRLRDGQTEEILHCGLMLIGACELEHYDEAGGILWLSANARTDRVSLFSWTEDGGLQLAHGDPLEQADLSEVLFLRGRPAVARYYGAGPRHYGLQAGMDEHLAFLREALPDAHALPLPSEGDFWLIREEGSTLRDPRYSLYQLSQRRLFPLQSEAVAPGAPEPARLSRKYFIEYPARDGLTVNGYLSLPKGRPLAETPLVALVHGGPWARVVDAYSAQVQLLTNRGYAVFEPNFRGSTGFGRDYVMAANREWGDGSVQNDIVDGLRYLLDNGIGDRDKLAIVGHSFGGFAVLSGLAFTPDLFKAGVALSPSADMGATMRFQLERADAGGANPSAGALMKALMVDIDDPDDMQALYAKSPLASLQRITAPLLLMTGADDRQVDVNHVKDYALTLLGQGAKLGLLIDGDEGHGLASDDAQAASLYLLEEFLALHLGGRREGASDERLARYLRKYIQINALPGFLEAP